MESQRPNLRVIRRPKDEFNPARDLLIITAREIESIIGGGRRFLNEPEAKRLLSIANCALMQFGERQRLGDGN